MDVAETEPRTGTDPASEEPVEMPLPSDPRVVLLAGLFFFTLLVSAYLAREIALPLVFAFTLNLLLQPVFRALVQFRAPKPVAALILILGLFAAIVAISTVISGPAGVWAQKLPQAIPRLQERLIFVREPIDAFQHFLQQLGDVGSTGERQAPAGLFGGETIASMLFASARSFASALFTTVLFLYFLLVSGDSFLRRLVEVLPRFSNKRQAVDIAQQIESDISAYLLTITIMNALVGAATGVVMQLTGVGDPLLWGTLAFLLNYAPILGPGCAMVIFFFVGLLTIEPFWLAMLPAGLYLLIHLAEGEVTTPMILARRFTLNPVLVILSLVFWFWMWGIAGAILSVPMLAITKIVCDRIRSLSALGHFLSG